MVFAKKKFKQIQNDGNNIRKGEKEAGIMGSLNFKKGRK
jgi:hypothetical protein